RKHASLNATAQRREPMTLDDYWASRWVVEPFRLLDCCQVSDGAGAFIVTSADRAKDLRKAPIYIAGYGQFHPHRFISDQHADATRLGANISGPDAFRRAGITPKDIDVAELYDCFTYVVLSELEDYGFCEKGEGAAFVQDGQIEIGGRLPVNTHGGLLSQGHVEGMLHVVEGVRQLRGGEVEPERQVPDARRALVSGHGGQMSTHGTLILSRDEP
ncbi:MAG: thiolase family protein, partial [Sulfobacillus sp.]